MTKKIKRKMASHSYESVNMNGNKKFREKKVYSDGKKGKIRYNDNNRVITERNLDANEVNYLFTEWKIPEITHLASHFNNNITNDPFYNDPNFNSMFSINNNSNLLENDNKNKINKFKSKNPPFN